MSQFHGELTYERIRSGLCVLWRHKFIRCGALGFVFVGVLYSLRRLNFFKNAPTRISFPCFKCSMGGLLCCQCPEKGKSMTNNSEPTQSTSNGATSAAVTRTQVNNEGHRQESRDSNRYRQHKEPAASSRSDNTDSRPRHSSGTHTRRRHRTASGGPEQIRHCILDTLKVIRTLVDNEQEPPYSLLRLHRIAEQDEGWLEMVRVLIDTIPLEDSLGPAVINLLLDECAIPTRDTIQYMCASHGVNAQGWNDADRWQRKHRNLCVVLGCLADKMAGIGSIALLSEDVLKYLIKNLEKYKQVPASVLLFSIIALEKFAQTSENKVKIQQALLRHQHLENLEKSWKKQKQKGFQKADDYLKWQVGFCAQWSLDNLFVKEGRKFSFEQEDMSRINVMLNSHDVSEYLKLAPNGLGARCDAPSFESVRCTYQVSSGVWYYEVLIVTAGVMQIGWATKDSKFLNHEGYGIGDDEHSIAYDGCRQLIWYNAHSQPVEQHHAWQPGDVLGLLLDLDKKEVIFSLNGECLPPCTDLFVSSQQGFFAAASFMSYQQCHFNFGAERFVFPPQNVDFLDFNSVASLSHEDKVILPRHKRLEMLKQVQVQDDSCNLCFDGPANIILLPCNHRGMCMNCAMQLETCPMCRVPIEQRNEETPS